MLYRRLFRFLCSQVEPRSQSGQVYYYATGRFATEGSSRYTSVPFKTVNSTLLGLVHLILLLLLSQWQCSMCQQWSSIEETRQCSASTDRDPWGQSEGVGQAVSYCVCHVTHRERVVFDDQPLVRCHLTLWDCTYFIPFSSHHDGLDAQAHHSLRRVTTMIMMMMMSTKRTGWRLPL